MNYQSTLDSIQKQLNSINSIALSSQESSNEQEETSNLLNTIGLEIQRQGGV